MGAWQFMAGVVFGTILTKAGFDVFLRRLILRLFKKGGSLQYVCLVPDCGFKAGSNSAATITAVAESHERQHEREDKDA